MAKKNDEGSPLVSAASALDAELRRYAELAEQIAQAPLGSEKAIDRVSRSVAEAVESDQRILMNVKALVEAINAAREAQQKSTDVLNERGGVIAQKRAELETLLVRFRGIGEVAKSLNEAMQKVATYKPDPYDAEAAKVVTETLEKIEEGMGECARHAGDLTKEAHDKGFEDVGRQADGLRQQLLSTKNRIAILRRQLGEAPKAAPS